MCAMKSFLWKKLITSTVTQAVTLTQSIDAKRVLVLGENTDALKSALKESANQIESIDIDVLYSVFSHSQENPKSPVPTLSVADGTYDLCIVSFSLHQFEPETAESIVRECLRIASKVLLIDFALAERNIELPSQYVCSLAEQFFHGGHWDIYQHYVRVGALHGIAHRAEASELANVTVWGGGVRLLLVG